MEYRANLIPTFIKHVLSWRIYAFQSCKYAIFYACTIVRPIYDIAFM